MARGILELVGFMTTVVFAVPLAIAGVDLLRRGSRLLGAGLLAAAATMLLIDRYVTRPGDVPGLIAARVVGLVASEPGEDERDDGR